MMGALRRVVRAPLMVAGLAGLHLLLAAGTGGAAGAAIRGSMGSYAMEDSRQLFYTLQELGMASPGLLRPIPFLFAGSAGITLVVWTLLAGGILHRLRGKSPLPKLAANTVSDLPAVLVVTLWHLLLRVVVLGIAGVLAVPLLKDAVWGPAGVLVLALALAICICALDLARCDAVLHGARRYHPGTAWRGFRQALGRPAVLASSMLFCFGQWACTAGIVWLSFAGLEAGLEGGAEIWGVRGLAILAVVLGLTRLAVAVEAGPYRR